MTDRAGEVPMPAADAHLVEGTAARRRLLDLAASADRRRALLVDPSLAASAQPVDEASDQEVREIKRSVLQARRLRKMDLAPGEPATGILSRLAMALALCLLLLLPSNLRRTPEIIPTTATAASATVPVAMTHSSVEALGLPGARVYELAEEEFSLVLVVDESFEL